jgi:5-methyltetrahydropteroyltriglutamate--homocysteine methyltransferase
MPTTSPPFRADHVGSLLRPPTLLRARADAAAGRLDAASLRGIEDAEIARIVRRQEEIGLPVVTDGEYRRASFLMDFYQRIAGLTTTGMVRVPFHDAEHQVDFVVPSVAVSDRLRLTETIFGDDFSYLASQARVTAKLTIPAPSILHRRGGLAVTESGAYRDQDQFFADLAAVYKEEVQLLGALGCRYLQFDDTSFATLCDPAHLARIAETGMDGATIHHTYIRLINEAIADRPAGMFVGVHTCRGNHRSSWFAEGGYEHIAEALFSELEVDALLLEYDDSRSGGFEPLRFFPRGAAKYAVLGLVSSKIGALESKDMVKRRVDEAARHMPLEQICLSPQCGFASTVEGNDISEDQQWAKLQLVVDVARDIWG